MYINGLANGNIAIKLGQRRHELTLAIKGDARNFFEKQLFKDTYS